MGKVKICVKKVISVTVGMLFIKRSKIEKKKKKKRKKKQCQMTFFQSKQHIFTIAVTDFSEYFGGIYFIFGMNKSFPSLR